MSATTFGWLVLALPAARHAVIALGFRSLAAAASAGWIGTGAIFLAFLAALAR